MGDTTEESGPGRPPIVLLWLPVACKTAGTNPEFFYRSRSTQSRTTRAPRTAKTVSAVTVVIYGTPVDSIIATALRASNCA